MDREQLIRRLERPIKPFKISNVQSQSISKCQKETKPKLTYDTVKRHDTGETIAVAVSYRL